jgi:hypothetical protein
MSADTIGALSGSSLISASEARPLKHANRYYKAYFYAFLIALVLCWSPSKFLAYFAPWVALSWFLLATRSQKTLRNLIIICLIWLGTVLLASVLTPGFVLHSAALSMLTYGSFIFIAAIPTRFIANHDLTERILAVIRWVVLIQGSWGIVQGISAAIRAGTFDGSVGDNVAGTIRPFGFQPDLSNPMFAINIAFMLIILLPSLITEGKGKYTYIIGMVALILASVMHALLFLAVAFAIAFVIYYPTIFRRQGGCIMLVGFLIAAVLASNILSNNFAILENYIQHTLSGRTARAQVIIRAYSSMPQDYPWMPFIGLGPGQFSSRAGLIGTGMYFGSPLNPQPLPLLPEGMSTPFRTHVLDLWLSLFFDQVGNIVHHSDNTSSTVKPYFSWLSLYAEFGMIGFVIALAFCAWLTLRVKIRTHTPSQKLTGISFGTAVIFLFLLGIQENYWEVPQAILLGLMLIKIQYAYLIYVDTSSQTLTA